MKKKTSILTGGLAVFSSLAVILLGYGTWESAHQISSNGNVGIEIGSAHDSGQLEVKPSTFKACFEWGADPVWKDGDGNVLTALTITENVDHPETAGNLYWSCAIVNNVSNYVALSSNELTGEFALSSDMIFTGIIHLPTISYVGGHPTSLDQYNSFMSAASGKVFSFQITSKLGEKPTTAFHLNGVNYGYSSDRSSLIATGYEQGITSTSIPKTYLSLPISKVSAGAFANCETLKAITFENPDLIIDNSAFANCTSLTDITLPANTECVYTNCFGGCKSLKTISIPSTCNTIGSNAFIHCDSLENIVIAEGLKNIYCAAFAYCGKISSFTFPSTMKVLKCTLFMSDTALTSLGFNGTVAQWNAVGKYNPNGTVSETAWREGSSITQVVCTDGTVPI